METSVPSLGFTLLEGSLLKWVNVARGWRLRWCILDPDKGLLTYYENQAQVDRGKRRGCLNLKCAQVGIDDQDECTFTLSSSGKTFYFRALNNEERTRWLNALCDAISRLAALGWLAEVEESTGALSKIDKKIRETDAYLQMLTLLLNATDKRAELLAPLDETRAQYSHIHDSASRVVQYLKQAVAALQTCKQNTVLQLDETLLASSGVTNLSCSSSPAHSCKSSPTHVASSAIVRTKSSASALLERYFRVRSRASPAQRGNFNVSERTAPVNGVALAKALHRLHAAASCDCLVSIASEHRILQHADQNLLLTRNRSANIHSERPALASSDAEEYFDADEYENENANELGCDSPRDELCPQSDSVDAAETNSGNTLCEDAKVKARSTECVTSVALEDTNSAVADACASTEAACKRAVTSRSSLISQVIAADDDEFDELYDELPSEDVRSTSLEGSVIMHLVKQVRVGMDLTKITLPTFILETRSTLEMYADFFAHPDLWIAIADQTSPRDRLMQTLRWFLSAFHAGRRSNVAKKPYNPILGEVFHCFWDVSNAQLKRSNTIDSAGTCTLLQNAQTSQNNSGNSLECRDRQNATDGNDRLKLLLDSGPVKSARPGSVTFISEQVSHHPPVSAFYAESVEKRMMLTGSIWTKSKFLGLSVSVEMVGQATIHLLDVDEQYTITFPTGYGRNILGQPWIELGGMCEIRCAKTGYYATVEFKTVPIYGGKRNRIKADAYQAGEKKPFVTVDGEWNDKMVAKWPGGRQELFVDTKTLPIVKKRVRPRSAQEPNESRRLWQEVTRALKLRRIDEATSFKQALETKQRTDAKQRETDHIVWRPAHFVPDKGKSWRFVRPLAHRLLFPASPSNS